MTIQPFNSDGGFNTTANVVAGNILVVESIGPAYPSASPAPSLNGFDSVNAINFSASGNVSAHDATFGGNINSAGNFDLDGNASIGGNLFVTGNINFTGNVTQISGNSGVFYGNASTGVGALYAGKTGYTPLPSTIVQITGDDNAYIQTNLQNTNHGNTASMELAITADDGTDVDNYIDMGIASSTWDGTQDNSLGDAVGQRDGYLYVQGGAAGGNLVLGTTTAGYSIKFNAGGPGAANTVGEINSDGISMVGNVAGNYILGNGSQLTGITVSGSNPVSTTGNVSGGNLIATGTVSATGNITANYFFGNGSQLTGLPATYGNSNVATLLSAFGSNTISTTGTITAGNTFTNGNAQIGTALQIIGSTNTFQTTNGSAIQFANRVNFNATGASIVSSGNISGANILGSVLSASGNVTGANILTAGQVSATGNITGNYILGNGSQLTGLPATYGNSNVTTLLSAFGSNTISTTGNVSVGNLLLNGTTVGYGVIAPTIGSNTSPITGAISATTTGTATTVLTAAIPAAGTWEITAQINCSLAVGQECTFALYDGTGTLVANSESKAGYIGGSATYQGQGTGIWRVTTVGAVNYTVRAFGPGAVAGCTVQSGGDGRTYVGWSLLSAPVTLNSMTVPTNISVVGNVTGGNVLIAGIVSATGNVTGNYILGNGSQLTGLPATYGNSNVTTLLAGFGSNTISTTGNISGSYIFGNGSQLTGLPATYGNSNVTTLLSGFGSNTVSTTGNISSGNLITSGSISSTGNVQAGNIRTAGQVSATGNITTAGNFVGNGAALSNVTVSVAGNVIGTQSNVTLVAGSYNWIFNNTGNLTLPGNTFAVNYANNTPVDVVARFESFWTVPTGNSTQSFTVAGGNTYQMWVDCNIPNGILTWNATATITNTNVPVVGAQYAWVYNGGGTPIDFTSIPNQFIGTSNTIVRSSVAPSATTNKFDFGINNTSGNSQTVRYGWIQIS